MGRRFRLKPSPLGGGFLAFGFGTHFWPSALGYLANIPPSLPHPPSGGCGVKKGAFFVSRLTG